MTPASGAAEQIKILRHHIKAGNWVSVYSILNEMEAQQTDTLSPEIKTYRPFSRDEVATMIEDPQGYWVKGTDVARLMARKDDTLSGLRTPSFDEWLKRLRACTTAFQHRSGAWTIFDQICHASSEVSEVYQAIRHDEGRPKMLEEICDSVLASITMAHVAGFTDAELGFAMEATLQKVERSDEWGHVWTKRAEEAANSKTEASE